MTDYEPLMASIATKARAAARQLAAADDATKAKLAQWDSIPATRVVRIPADWGSLEFAKTPDEAVDQAKLDRLGYQSLDEKVAERFHTTVEVLERANSRVVGRVINEHGVMIVVPENRRLAQDILVAPGGRKKPEAGQIVTVELVEQPTKFAQPIGRIVEVLGNYADPGMEIEIALRKHDLPYEFSSEAKAQTRKLPDVVRKKDWAGREDLTKLPLVTIDGETARDFDDAVYCERQGKGYRLIVAIADVSHYVDAASALDKDAFDRGNSVYFPRRVIPMLPEKLSNGLCSLNPQVERLAMVADMAISVGAVAPPAMSSMT